MVAVREYHTDTAACLYLQTEFIPYMSIIHILALATISFYHLDSITYIKRKMRKEAMKLNLKHLILRCILYYSLIFLYILYFCNTNKSECLSLQPQIRPFFKLSHTQNFIFQNCTVRFHTPESEVCTLLSYFIRIIQSVIVQKGGGRQSPQLMKNFIC